MTILRLKNISCSALDRNDVSYFIASLVVVVVSDIPKNVEILGKVYVGDAAFCNHAWWLLGYSLETHMLYGQMVEKSYPVSIMCQTTLLRTVAGATCVFDSILNKAVVITSKKFPELKADDMSENALVASFIATPPEHYNLELGYVHYKVHKDTTLLPYVTDWLELDVEEGVTQITIPEGVKHLELMSAYEDVLVHLPDSIVSCYIHKDVQAALTIPKRFANSWRYWSQVWGKIYSLPESYRMSPDGRVKVHK